MQEPSFSYELVDFVEGPALTLRGEFDTASAPVLRTGLRRLSEQAGPRVFVDLLHVRFLDSSGVAAMVDATRDLRDDVAVTIIDPSPDCAVTLAALGVDDYEVWLP